MTMQEHLAALYAELQPARDSFCAAVRKAMSESSLSDIELSGLLQSLAYEAARRAMGDTNRVAYIRSA